MSKPAHRPNHKGGNSAARAQIPHAAAHTAMKWGKVPQYNNPNYEVENQMEPTEKHPLRRRYQIAGGRK